MLLIFHTTNTHGSITCTTKCEFSVHFNGRFFPVNLG